MAPEYANEHERSDKGGLSSTLSKDTKSTQFNGKVGSRDYSSQATLMTNNDKLIAVSKLQSVTHDKN